jgi:glycine/D-amino acid oxidase-like deaminating enzyme
VKRIFPAYAYGAGPRDGCWWDTTCDVPETPTLRGHIKADVAIIGAGFTGLNAALTLANAGLEVVVLDAQSPGWGASGRNGGFCCLGGAKASDRQLDRQFGRDGRLEWRRTEVDAVRYVEALLQEHKIDVDRHSKGETLLAHRPMSFDEASVSENYGVAPVIHDDLAAQGLNGPFAGAMTIPIGFALNPRKYLAGLLRAANQAGTLVFGGAPARIGRDGVETDGGRVQAGHVLIATNGYSSEDIPHWLAGRYMPAQSAVLVTRRLSADELARQGWNSTQMCYDSRHLLHYFRLMPDGRFLFGRRGGLGASPGAEARVRRALIRDFNAMFPAWRDVALEATWSGMVALSRHLVPFAGPVPGSKRVWASLCYHGNGVAMGSYLGHLTARALLGDDLRPRAIKGPMRRFPLGGARRMLMVPVYAGLHLRDCWPR